MPTEICFCPTCEARMSPSPDGTKLWCQFCGATRDDAAAQQQLAALQAQAAQQDTTYEPPTRDWDMPIEERRALDLAWECIQEGDHVTAKRVLDDALFGKRHTFADAWYLLSLTTDDADQKLRYLDHALAIQPYHEYAWRDKGVLEGVIPAEAAPVEPEADRQDTVEAASQTQACPLCGGLLALDVALGVLVCGSCCFRPDLGPAVVTRRSFDKLENALLQRRFGFSKEWQVGARLLVCQNCHAQLTLTQTTLATRCPFCDSAHVLVQDAVDSFEEPDALLPFKIDRAAAAKALHRRLPVEIRGGVERGEMWGVYLPFWSFMGLVSIMFPPDTLVPVGMRTGAFDVGEALVGGITRPSQAVLYELMPYQLADLVPYDPRYLGGAWSAQVYNVDVVQASITARAYAKHIARRMAQSPTFTPPAMDLARTDSHVYNPPDTPLWRMAQITIEALHYRLLLLPVWMITLHLRNGTRLPAIVNGQTGEALLSASFISPETIIAGPGRAPVEPLPVTPPGPTMPTRAHQPARDVIRPISSITPSAPPEAARKNVIRPITLD